MDALAASLRHAVSASRECEPAARPALCTPDVLEGCRSLVRLRDDQLRVLMPLALDALRLLRNLCARAPAVQTRLLDEGVLDEVVGLLEWVRTQPLERRAECALAGRVCVQVLGNAVVGNAATQAWLWSTHFPRLLGALVADADPSLQSCACMCLFSCARDHPPRQRALALSAAALQPLARSAAGVAAARRAALGGGARAPAGGRSAASDGGSQCSRQAELDFSWALATIDLLLRSPELAAVALRTARAPSPAAGAPVGPTAAACPPPPSAAACLLDAFDFLLAADEGSHGGGRGTVSAAGPAVRALAAELSADCACQLATLAHWDAAAYAAALEAAAPRRATEPLALARAGLRLLGTAALHDGGAVAAAAHEHGLVGSVGSLLGRLLRWAPPVLARDARAVPPASTTALPLPLPPDAVGARTGLTAGGGDAVTAAAAAASGGGLKTVLVRYLANVTFRDRRSQRALRESEALSALLCCCRDDDANPQLREWALFAVRNSAEGCAENQAFIAQLESAPRAVANADELERAGMEVRIDRVSGKVRVRQAGAPDAAGALRAEAAAEARAAPGTAVAPAAAEAAPPAATAAAPAAADGGQAVAPVAAPQEATHSKARTARRAARLRCAKAEQEGSAHPAQQQQRAAPLGGASSLASAGAGALLAWRSVLRRASPAAFLRGAVCAAMCAAVCASILGAARRGAGAAVR